MAAVDHGSLDFTLKVIELAVENILQQAARHGLRDDQEAAVAQIMTSLGPLTTGDAHEDSHQILHQPSQTLAPTPLCDHHHPQLDTHMVTRPEDACTKAGGGEVLQETRVIRGRMQSVGTAMMTEAKSDLRRTRRLVAGFSLADLDSNGIVSVAELHHCLLALGTPPAEAKKFMRNFDANSDGIVSQQEFLVCCEQPGFNDVVERMANFCASGVVISPPRDKWMLSRVSQFRIGWDALVLFLLIVIAFTAPLSLAFSDFESWMGSWNFDTLLDCFLLLDMILNFRTGYFTTGGFEVLRARQVACQYLKTWFILDLVSVIPYRFIAAGLPPGMVAIRLLKVGKVAKVLKAARFAQALKASRFKVIVEEVDDLTTATKLSVELVVLKLLFGMFLTCHWLGCCMAAITDGCVKSSDEDCADVSSFWYQYVTVLYWAGTTVSTVGYGDILPSGVEGRLFAMFAMVVGGAFYAFVVANLTTVMTTHSASDRIYSERMNEVKAWLDFHKFPPHIRHRIRRYFAEQLRHQVYPDEELIMSQLSPGLQSLLGDWVVGAEVRRNPLLRGLPPNLMNRLCFCIQFVVADEDEHVVTNGELGYAMFVVTQGSVAKLSVEGQQQETLELGDSFGEEVLCGLEVNYEYSVIAKMRSSLQSLPCASFARELPNVPAIMDLLQRNYCKYCKAAEDAQAGGEDQGAQAWRDVHAKLDEHRDHQLRLTRSIEELVARERLLSGAPEPREEPRQDTTYGPTFTL